MAILGLDHILPVLDRAPTTTAVPLSGRPRVTPVRQGLLGVLAVLLTAAFAATAVGMQSRGTVLLVALVAAWLGFSHLALPAYERAVSFTPVVRFAAAMGAAAFVSVVAGVAQAPAVQRTATVLGCVLVVAAASTTVHRVALRRTPTVVVGPVDRVERLCARWSDRPDVRVVDTYAWTDALDLSEHRSDIVTEVLGAVARHGASSVTVVSGEALSSPALRHLAWALQRSQVECLVVADMSDHTEALRPRRVGDQVALSLGATGDHLASALVKSVIDRVGAAVGLVLLAPVLLAIAIAVRLDSPGPAVFSQVRSGRDGRPFRMYKFRTMVPDAESRLASLLERNEGAGPLFKMADDPRITRVGRILRRTSLDELLQLINVVRGEMSLVGPRPALPSETAAYDPWAWRRLHVRPGLTGLWQVNGRSSLSWEESVRMDLRYVNHQSLRLDLSILVSTVRAVVRRDGAH
jgi:exopolysaccharide biosynthesis polyprenyl glycosylphosphotransferase